MALSDYKDIFGKPGEGVHSIRILNIALIDLGLTILVAYCISFIWKLSMKWTLPFMFLLGILTHRAFGVRTTIDTLLFP